MSFIIPLLKLEKDKIYENKKGQHIRITEEGKFFLRETSGVFTECDPIADLYRALPTFSGKEPLSILLQRVNEADAFKKTRAEALLLSRIVTDLEEVQCRLEELAPKEIEPEEVPVPESIKKPKEGKVDEEK